MKFGRYYRLTIQDGINNEAIIIEPPTTVSFSVQRNTMASLNSMTINIYNLSPETRSRIFQDRFRPLIYKSIIFEAGYQEISTIFVGNIFSAHSERQGTEVVTIIEAKDGGYDTVTTKSFKTIAKGTTKKELIQNLISDFPNLKEGNLNVEGEFRRPIVVDGNNFDNIQKYADGKAFIDMQKVHVLKDNDIVDAEVPLITSKTGLLGTPKRMDSYLSVDTVFEPRIIMAQIVEIKSDIQAQYDGQYKVIGLRHTGLISEAISGRCTSTFNLMIGSQLFGEFNRVSA